MLLHESLTWLEKHPTVSGKDTLSHGHFQHHTEFQLLYGRKHTDVVHKNCISESHYYCYSCLRIEERPGLQGKVTSFTRPVSIEQYEEGGHELQNAQALPHTWTWNRTKPWHRNKSQGFQNISTSSLSLFPNRKRSSPKHIPKYVINYPMNHIPHGNCLAEVTPLKIHGKRQRNLQDTFKERMLSPPQIIRVNTKPRKSWSHHRVTRFVVYFSP